MMITSSSEEPVELGAQCHRVDGHGIISVQVKYADLQQAFRRRTV